MRSISTDGEASFPEDFRGFAERAARVTALDPAELATQVAAGLARLRVQLLHDPETALADPLATLLTNARRSANARAADDARAELETLATRVAECEERARGFEVAFRARSEELLAAAEKRDAAEREVAHLRIALEREASELSAARTGLISADCSAAALEQRISELQAELEASKSEHARLSISEVRSGNELEQVVSANSALESALREAERRSSDLEGRLHDAEHLARANEHSANAFERRAIESERDAHEIEERERELRVSLERTRAERDDALRARIAKEADNAALAARILDLEIDLAHTRADLAWRTGEMNSLSAALARAHLGFTSRDVRARVQRWNDGPPEPRGGDA